MLDPRGRLDLLPFLPGPRKRVLFPCATLLVREPSPPSAAFPLFPSSEHAGILSRYQPGDPMRARPNAFESHPCGSRRAFNGIPASEKPLSETVRIGVEGSEREFGGSHMATISRKVPLWRSLRPRCNRPRYISQSLSARLDERASDVPGDPPALSGEKRGDVNMRKLMLVVAMAVVLVPLLGAVALAA